eukprot:1392582-Pyramimonas_sp.AAC.1
MERHSKLRKIAATRASPPHVSQSALSALIAKASNGELPDACSTADIRAARKLETDVVTPYGPLLTKVARVVLNTLRLHLVRLFASRARPRHSCVFPNSQPTCVVRYSF